MRSMNQLSLSEKRVLIREDLNVPLRDGKVANDARLRAAAPSIKAAVDAGGRVIVMSHLGRPTEGEFDDQYSLAPVADALSELLQMPVCLQSDWPSGAPNPVKSGCSRTFDLTRVKKATPMILQSAMRPFVMCLLWMLLARRIVHRHPHTVWRNFAAEACAGPLLSVELEALARALSEPATPMVAVVGGSKVSTKLAVLERLSEVCDQLVVGGGIANTFLAAAGYPVGKSLCEMDLIPTAKALMAKTRIPLPIDVVVAKEFSDSAEATVKLAADVADDDMILDIGPLSQARMAEVLVAAGTILWNGPVGVFEFDAFAGGTRALSNAVAESEGFSVAGGGDTLAAIDQFEIADRVSYISTGGGAFLEFVEGKTLPAVAILEDQTAS